MEFERILLKGSAAFATITMNRPQRRNALPLAHMRELISAITHSAVWSRGRTVTLCGP